MMEPVEVVVLEAAVVVAAAATAVQTPDFNSKLALQV